MKSRRSTLGIMHAYGYVLLAAITATLLTPAPGLADWAKDAQEAAIKYADDKKDEFVKDQAKAAILALYKKLYRSSADLGLSRTLASVAISAPELNKLMNDTAEAYASGDPEKIREASEKVAVSFGQQLSKLASNSQTRKQLGAIIGSADKVKELSGVLGQVAAGTDEGRREAAKYVGETLISLTPAAGVVGFYQTAYGVMKYANDEFIDSNIEDLYRDYKSGKLSEAGLKEQLGRAPYDYIVRDKIKELREEKTAGIADAAKQASDALKEHLTRTTDAEVIRNIVASFDGRVDKERQDKAAATEREKAKKEAENILEKLNDVASQRHGSNWDKTRSYDLDRFTKMVRDALKTDGVLDPNNPLHVKLVSKAASTALVYGKVHGKNSKEYTKVLDELAATKKSVIEGNKGAPCLDRSPTEALAARLWRKGKQLVAAGKTSAALPVLKQSLEFCPDEDRAKYLAALGKPETPGPQEFDGTYAGEITFKTYDMKTPLTLTGSMTLTIKDEVVTGAMMSRQHQPGGAEGDAVRKGDISGRVSPEGRITATVKGKSAMEITPGGKREKAIENIVAWAGLSYSFEGSFTGQVSDGQGSGNFSATRLGRPNNLVGTWKASRK